MDSQDAAESRHDGGSIARLILTSGEAIKSLKVLEHNDGPFDGIVVAAGAASGVIEEVEAARVPLSLCQASSSCIETFLLSAAIILL